MAALTTLWRSGCAGWEMSVLHHHNLPGDQTNAGEIEIGTEAKPVVFLFPGLSGSEEELGPLGDGCRAVMSPVSVSFPDWTTIDYSLINLDGLIAHSIAQIQLFAPRGPVMLAGYSFGGHIALAVAEGLQASGRRVGCLALLDTWAIPPIEKRPVSVTRPTRRLAQAMRRREVGAEVGRIIGAILIRLQNKKISRFVGRIPRFCWPRSAYTRINVSISMSFTIPVLEELLRRMAESDKSFNFPAVLFRCAEQTPGAAADLGWGRHFANLRVVPILGNHVTLTAPENLPSFCKSFAEVITDMHAPVG